MSNDLPPAFDEMAKMLGTNPLKAIRTAQKANLSVDRMKYEVAAIGYGYAAVLRDNKAERDNFYDESFWENRERPLRRDKLLLHVFMYLYGGYKGAPANRAGEHSRALEKDFDANKPFSEIPQHLEDSGGFDGLLNARNAGDDEAASLDPVRPAPKPTLRPPTVAEAVDEETDNEDLEGMFDEDDDSNAQVLKPQGIKLEQGGQNLKLLPRGNIARHILFRHRDPETHDDMLQALLEGKTVTVDLIQGGIDHRYELYSGAGNFVEIVVSD